MKRRAVMCTLLAFAALFLAVACAPVPLSPTPTLPAKPPSKVPTAIPSPTATLVPSPTRPTQPQLVREVTLRSLPDVGHNPQAIAVLDGRIYVANRSTDNVSVIEGDKVVEVIAVGDTPVALAADHKTGLVYVANEGEDSISIISGNRVVRTVSAPKSPACLAALDGHLYAGGRGENALAVLDGVSGKHIATVPLKASIGILALAVNPTNQLLYASVYRAVEIVNLKELTIVGRLDQEVYLTLGVDPTSERFFITEYDAKSGEHYLVAYDALGQREVGRVLIGGDPRGMDIDASGGRIYVANSWTNDISVIDGRTLNVIASVPVGLRPLDVAVGRDGQVYVVNSGSNNVALMDGETNRLLAVVPLAMLPGRMAVDAGTGRLYIACASTNSVFVLDGERVVAEIPAGLHPTEVALTPDGETLFVLNHVGGDLMLISTRDMETIQTVKIGERPQGLAVVPETRQLYVSDAVLDADGLRLLRRTELLTIYRSTVKPTHIQADPVTGRAYMVASNGVPGSNSGLVVYVVDMKSGERVEGGVGGLSMTGLALGLEAQRIFSTAGRFGYHQLIVNDASSLKQLAVLGVPKYPAALAYNPETHHIFICLTYTSSPAVESGPELWVFDSRGLGTVTHFQLPGEPEYGDPYALTVDALRGYVYLSDTHRGTVHVLRDVPLLPPPSPTPTHTPTLWPTLTPQPKPSLTATVAAELTCEQAPGRRFDRFWSDDISLRLGLGCPVEGIQSGFMAEQPFERGHMIWREADRTILVLYNDGVWRSFPDRWQEGMPQHSCEATPPGSLLQPIRGFGWVWCAEKGVKEGLGWAVEEERGYNNEWQVFERGEMIASGARAVIHALFADGIFLEYPAH
jgi:YVTN family beta-propeller protein